MFFATMNFNHKRRWLAVLTVLLVVLLTIFFIKSIPPEKNADTADKRCVLLEEYGFSVAAASEKVTELTLPSSVNDAFESYNRLQTVCGFDLTKYCGETVWRYSYVCDGYTVSIFVSDGAMVGGDIYDGEGCKYLPLSGEINGNDQNR